LWQEGAVFKSVKIVENNVFMENKITEAFNFPATYPGCSGSRYFFFFSGALSFLSTNKIF